MKIIINNIYTTVTECSEKEEQFLEKSLTVTMPGYKYTKAFKSGRWDGQKHFYNSTSGTFLSGFLPFISSNIVKKKWKITLEDHRHFEKHNTRINIDGLRLYQRNGIDNFCNHFLYIYDYKIPWARGIFKYPTGAGKGVTMARLVDALKLNTLYLVERIDNLHQTNGVFKKWCEHDTGLIGDSAFDPALITFAMVQTLRSRLTELPQFIKFYKELSSKEKQESDVQQKLIFLKKRSEELRKFFQNIRVLIVDECHKVSLGIYHDIALRCVNASIRIGSSGTPLVRADIGDAYLIGDTGEILAEVDRQTLEKQGYLAKAKIYFKSITKPADHNAKYATAYKDLIVDNIYRNEQILRMTKVLLKKNCTILILVKRIEHGKNLVDLLTADGLQVYFVSGKDESRVRRELLDGLGRGFKILISSTIFDESIDSFLIDGVIIASGDKSRIKAMQRLGRGSRPKDGRNIVYLIDFIDRVNKYLLSHSLERLNAYKESGFTVKVVQ